MKVIWIHGWGMSSHIWEDNASLFLPESEHRFLDFRPCHIPQHYVQAVKDEMTASAEPVVLIGWSMGGMLALQAASELARQHPGQVQGLILIASTLRFVTPDKSTGWPERVLTRMKKRLQADPRQVLEDFWRVAMPVPLFQQSRLFFAGVDEEDITAEQQSPSLLAGLDYLTDADVTADWQSLRDSDNPLRFLWIHGKKDVICPAKAMPAGLAEHEQWLIDDAGHVPFLTHPELCYSRIRRFLNDDQ